MLPQPSTIARLNISPVIQKVIGLLLKPIEAFRQGVDMTDA